MGVKGRYGADVVSDVIKRLVLVVALVRRGVHWADDQLAMAGHDKRPVSVKDFVEFRPLVVFGTPWTRQSSWTLLSGRHLVAAVDWPTWAGLKRLPRRNY